MKIDISTNQPILITGAAGMIGSCVVRYLNNLGFTNLILVDLLGNSGKWKNLVGKQFSDLVSPTDVFEYLRGREDEIGAYIHLGACSDTMENNADFLAENNYRFTIKLASLALKENKRFIYASSAATYGDGSLGFLDDEEALEALKPLNMYGYSKHLVDLWMKKEGVLGSVVGLKYFNVFGPNEYHKEHMASWVMKNVPKVIQEGKVSLFKSTNAAYQDGEQKRDFIYVKDAVMMTCKFLEKAYFDIGGIYNIGLGEPTSWNSMAKYLFKALKKEENIQYIDMPLNLASQYQNYTCADMKKFFALFPEKLPLTPLQDAVQDYVNSYLLTKSNW